MDCDCVLSALFQSLTELDCVRVLVVLPPMLVRVSFMYHSALMSKNL